MVFDGMINGEYNPELLEEINVKLKEATIDHKMSPSF